jgi:hypothetical protein
MTIRTALGFMFIVLSLSTVTVKAQSQPRERTISRLPVEQNELIGLTAVKVNGERVFAKKPFLADDEWLKGLVVSVKNRSDKRILFVSVQLQFPRPIGSQETLSIFDISYGAWALQTRPPTNEERLTGIAPGETMEIRMSEQRYNSLRQFLNETLYPSSIDKVDLRINSVIFEDDTMWTRGTEARRDPSDPTSWVRSRDSKPH